MWVIGTRRCWTDLSLGNFDTKSKKNSTRKFEKELVAGVGCAIIAAAADLVVVVQNRLVAAGIIRPLGLTLGRAT